MGRRAVVVVDAEVAVVAWCVTVLERFDDPAIYPEDSVPIRVLISGGGAR